MCKLLKTRWSGRVYSNHRPPGPEPWEGPFCRLLQVVAAPLIYSSLSRFLSEFPTFCFCSPLQRVCSRSMHEKGKKRASLGKALIPRPVVGTAVQRLHSGRTSQGRLRPATTGPPGEPGRECRLGCVGDWVGSLNCRSAVRRTIKNFAHRSGAHRLFNTQAIRCDSLVGQRESNQYSPPPSVCYKLLKPRSQEPPCSWARARTDPPVLSKNDPGSL